MTKRKGFTLVEIMVVTLIFSVVASGVFATFVSGMKTWDRVKRMNLVRGHIFLTMERVAGELRQSVDISQIDFEGEESWLSFPARVGGDIFKIAYLFDPGSKAVSRQQTLLLDINEGEKEDYTEKRVLTADNFSVQYLFFDQGWDAYLWNDTWEENSGSFSAVRFLIEKDDEMFSKTIFVPIAG